MKFYYYSITNNINGHRYIGITENLTRRWQEHKNDLVQNKHSNIHLQNAWNKYGKENFNFELIEEKDFEDKQEAYNYEWKLIQELGYYNILEGALLNPIYTKEIYNKMVNTKQSKVDNIIQLKQIEENTYEIIKIWNSMKEPSRLENFSFRNIQNSVKNYVKGDGYYWVKEKELSIWKPVDDDNYVAEIDENNNILSVAKTPRFYEKQNGWAVSSICNAIKRNGKTHNRKFIFIDYKTYLKYKPLIIKPVSTRTEA